MDVKELIRSKESIHAYFSQKEKNGMYLCPFHKEKTGSFSVDEEGQLFKCFGCAEAGDIFSFVSKQRNLSFYETLKELADKHNIQLHEKDNKQVKHIKELEEMHTVFKNQSPEIMNYMNKRGIDDDTWRGFGVGYGGSNGYDMGKKFEGKGAGHVSKGYLTLANRCIFPIHDQYGGLVGFSGRTITNDKVKYINSSSSEVFDKSSILYNIHRAKKHAKECGSLVIVEGQMDVVQCWQHGIKNVTAVMGTGFTEKHVSLLKKILPETQIIFCFDNDRAGKEATFRSLKVAKSLYPTVVEIEDLRGSGISNSIGDLDELLQGLAEGQSLTHHELSAKSMEGVMWMATQILPSRVKAKLKKKTHLLKKIREYVCYEDPVMVDQQLRILQDILGIRSLDMLRYEERSSVS